jgi:hypothetical protein
MPWRRARPFLGGDQLEGASRRGPRGQYGWRNGRHDPESSNFLGCSTNPGQQLLHFASKRILQAFRVE